MKKVWSLLTKNRTNPLAARAIIGLGNPGLLYRHTRHNVGFQTLEALRIRIGGRFRSSGGYRYLTATRSGRAITLVKPQTFMNQSGQIYASLASRFGIAPDNMAVIVDTLDLPPGSLRIKIGGGSAGHNGLKSLLRHIPENLFLRFYIGVGRPSHKNATQRYVLSVPPKHDRDLIELAVNDSVDALEDWFSGIALNELTNRYNRKDRVTVPNRR